MDFNDAPPQSEAIAKSETRVTADELKQQVHDRLLEVLYYMFPEGKVEHNKFLIGNIYGHAGESLNVELSGDKIGLWYDFATGEGDDILTLWGVAHGWDKHRHFPEIVTSVQEWLGTYQSPLPQRDTATEGIRESQTHAPQTQVPQPEARVSETLGALTGKWAYKDVDGNLLAWAYRYDPPKRKKEIRYQDAKTGQWTIPCPRPLYNQPGIARSDTVILVEGEKCAEALINLGICATTAMNGANAIVDKTDWSPLLGKHVLVWPDHDAPGKTYADKAVKKLEGLGIASLTLMVIPEDKPDKWDAADAIDEGTGTPGMDVRAFMDACPKITLSPSILSSTDGLPAFTVGQLLDDDSPLPEDLVAPRILTPGGLLVFGGAPKAMAFG